MYIAGVDEVGRGPLVGDVVTAAVILDPNNHIEGLGDSKAISEKKRLVLFSEIQDKALAWSVGRASPEEIDEFNILHATMLAMTRAVDALSIKPDFVQVDGNRIPPWQYRAEAVVKGDSKVACIGAASIIAKVTRDQDMALLDERHPEYGFAQHKGYPTKAHISALQKLPVLSEYRLSFKPVAQILANRTNV